MSTAPKRHSFATTETRVPCAGGGYRVTGRRRAIVPAPPRVEVECIVEPSPEMPTEVWCEVVPSPPRTPIEIECQIVDVPSRPAFISPRRR